jgi:hypothetical protein
VRDAYETDLVRKILAGIARAGERYGRRRIAGMLVGEPDLPPALASLRTAGLLRHEPRETVEDWIDAAVGARLVAVSGDQYRTLSLTPAGREVMTRPSGALRMAAPGSGTLARRGWHRL